MTLANRGEQFFFVMGVVLIAFVVAGFAPFVFTRPGGPLEMPALLHAHGLLFVLWFVLFLVQARLIGSGNTRLHMSLGKASVVLAVAIVIVAYFVMRGAYSNPDWQIGPFSHSASVMFPFTDILNFAIAYSLALFHRRTPEAHKRLMLMAGILIMDPAIARLVFVIGAPFPMILLLELSLFLAVAGYDVKTRRKPHWATMLGLGLFIFANAAKFTVAQQQWWASFVDIILG